MRLYNPGMTRRDIGPVKENTGGHIISRRDRALRGNFFRVNRLPDRDLKEVPQEVPFDEKVNSGLMGSSSDLISCLSFHRSSQHDFFTDRAKSCVHGEAQPLRMPEAGRADRLGAI